MAFLDGCNSASSASMMLLAAQLAAILHIDALYSCFTYFYVESTPFH
jgi:hypothetical protein